MNFKVWDWSRNQLYGLVTGTFVKIGVCSLEQTDAFDSLISFIHDVEDGYFVNPYHSFLHAVDVLYVTYYILIDLDVASILGMNKMEMSALLIAALTHDILHPGVNNLFHVNSQSELAAKYAGKSVLENLSCDKLKELLDKHGILEKLEYGYVEPVSEAESGNILDQRVYMNRMIMDAIINTDMCFHFQLLQQLSRMGIQLVICNMCSEKRRECHWDYPRC